MGARTRTHTAWESQKLTLFLKTTKRTKTLIFLRIYDCYWITNYVLKCDWRKNVEGKFLQKFLRVLLSEFMKHVSLQWNATLYGGTRDTKPS